MCDTPLQTPVLTMLHAMYDLHNANKAGWSWNRLNGVLAQTLTNLITVGADFALDDFTTLAADARLCFAYWAGTETPHRQGERFYRTAVETHNRSACRAFEQWKQRKPFIYDGGRLFVGAPVRWQGEWCTCTSFTADGQAVILCSTCLPDPDPCPTCGRWGTRAGSKLLHRYTVTWEALHGRTGQKARTPRRRALGQEKGGGDA